MNPYTALIQRQQEEVNNLPIGFAFDQGQFDQMMRNWGLDPDEDLDKIYSIGTVYSIGAGGFVQEKDEQFITQTMQRHQAERTAAIAADLTGDEFIYWMFLSELSDHGYGYTGDLEETLDALGYTWEEVCADKRLHHGLKIAIKKLLEDHFF